MVFIEMYNKDGCKACLNAKKLLQERNIAFNEYIIGKDITREKVLEMFPGVRNAPVIVVDGQWIKEVEDFQLLLEQA